MSERAPREHPRDEEDEEIVPENLPSRRNILGQALAGAALLSGMKYIQSHRDRLGELNSPSESHRTPLEEGPEEFDATELHELTKQNGIGPWYGMYLGLPTDSHAEQYPFHIPKKLAIDGPAALSALQELKQRTWSNRLAKEGRRIDPEVMRIADERVINYTARWADRDQYDSRGEAIRRTSLPELLGRVQKRIGATYEALERPEVQQKLLDIFGIHGETGILSTVLTLLAHVNAITLHAYAMTESFPGTNGELSAAFDNFLLESLGEEFKANGPSLGDPDPSFGPFQFTEHAIGEPTGPHDRAKTVGASVVNQALPEDLQIPKTLSDIYNLDDHYAAAFLFVVDNLMYAAQHLPPAELREFAATDPHTLIEFIATSHNNPSVANTALHRYLSAKIEAEHPSKHHHAPTHLPVPISFIDACREIDMDRKADEEKRKHTEGERYHPKTIVSLAEYAEKTEGNLAGLEKYLAQHA